MKELNAVQRLAAIEASNILRAQAGESIQALCKSLCTTLHGDRAQINVITATEQVFIGDWPKPRRWKKPIPLQRGGCREVVLAEHTVAIEDTREHPVFCLMPWVTEEWLGYLGAPIFYKDEILGTMCVLTHSVRSWTHADIAVIEGFSARIAPLL